MAKGKYRKREEWERLVGEYRDSGESQRVFAERHQLSAKSLSRWSGRLSRERRGRAAPSCLPGQGFAEVVAQVATTSFERTVRDGPVLWIGESVRLQLPACPSPEYVSLVARVYEMLSP